MSNSLQPHGLQHPRLPCLSLSPRVCSDSYPLSRWCYLTISYFAVLFSFCLESYPSSGSFPMSWLFALGGQRIGTSASAWVLIYDWLHVNISQTPHVLNQIHLSSWNPFCFCLIDPVSWAHTSVSASSYLVEALSPSKWLVLDSCLKTAWSFPVLLSESFVDFFFFHICSL